MFCHFFWKNSQLGQANPAPTHVSFGCLLYYSVNPVNSVNSGSDKAH